MRFRLGYRVARESKQENWEGMNIILRSPASDSNLVYIKEQL